MNGKVTFLISEPSPEKNDLRHWNAFREGSKTAFTAIYNQHVDVLYHYGERLTADKTLIEDCIQDLFAELWTRQTKLPKVQTVKFYLFKALKRKINRKRVQQAKFLSETLADYDFELTLPTTDQDAHPFPEAQKAIILQALNQLTPRQKEAITLRFYDNFSYTEIAEIMDLSDRSVYNLTYRALAILRRTVKISDWQRVLLLMLLILLQ